MLLSAGDSKTRSPGPRGSPGTLPIDGEAATLDQLGLTVNLLLNAGLDPP